MIHDSSSTPDLLGIVNLFSNKNEFMKWNEALFCIMSLFNIYTETTR